MNPYQVVKDFEKALCDYTGARYAVTTTSCTMALLLACRWHYEHSVLTEITIPKRTYVSVPQSVIRAGFNVKFRDERWFGSYLLDPYPIRDSARSFHAGMYHPGEFQCVSFHWSKILGIGQGGAILHDNPEADEWFRKMRFDGRTEGVAPKDDNFTMLGYHCYMSPRDAAEGISRLALLPEYNNPLPNDPYPDLSQFKVFK